jgi:hypothetical protein
MTLKAISAFAMMTIIGLGVQVEARTPCQEYLRLSNAATEAWKQAMRAPSSERCGALHHASLAAEATLKYADNNRESCDISVQLLNQVEGYHREAVQARGNACAGRPSTVSSRYHPTLRSQEIWFSARPRRQVMSESRLKGDFANKPFRRPVKPYFAA